MSLPESESSPLDAFLAQFEKDKAEGSIRPLEEYIRMFPGAGEGIASQYLRDKNASGPSSFSLDSQDENQLGPYRIERELGRGGQGEVYLAEDTQLKRKVALKVLRHLRPGSEHIIQRFQREAEMAANLDHAGICGVHDAGIINGTPYIAMQYIEGETLAQRLAASRQSSQDMGLSSIVLFSETHVRSAIGSEIRGENAPDSQVTSNSMTRREILEILHVFEKAARALHAAHEAGVVHRDIKPGNIMLNREGEPVILDFGLARSDDPDHQTLTRTGDLFGTPAYMSPEQLMGQRIQLDRRTDVYSLGATLYECLTLRKPFEAPTREALYQAVMTDDPSDARRLNAAIPKDLRIVLDAALEKNRDKRYQTALDLAEDLRRVREVQPVRAKPIGPLRRTIRWAQRRPYRAASVFMLFVISIAISWYIAKAPERAANEDKARDQEALERRREAEDKIQHGFLDLDEKFFKDALNNFERALRIAPASTEAVAGKAIALSRMDRNGDALAWLHEHLATNGGSAGLTFVLGWVLKPYGPDPGAGNGRLPETAEDYFIKGYLTAASGRPKLCENAIPDLTQATMMSSEPRCLYVVQLARAAAGASGQYIRVASDLERHAEVAQRCIQALKVLWHHDKYAWYGMGMAYRAQDNTAMELEAYKQAIALDPDFMVAHVALSNVYSRRGLHEEALASANDAIQLNPKFGPAWLAKLKAYARAQSFDAAEGVLRELNSQFSRDARVLNGAAWILVDPRWRTPFGNGRRSWLMESQPTFAVDIAREAVRLSNRGDASLLHTLAFALELAGELDEAVQVAEEAIVILNHPAANERLKDNLENAKTRIAARKKVEATNRTDPATLETLAMALGANEDFYDAIATCKRAIEMITRQDDPDRQLKDRLKASLVSFEDGLKELLRRFKRAAENQ